MAGTSGTDDRDDELADLRAEVAALKSQVRDVEAPRQRVRWGRGFASVTLLVLAGLLLPAATSAVWAERLVSSTDRYVQTVSPLAEDPEMQAAITARITAEIAEYVDVADLTDQAFDALAANGRLDPRVADQLSTLSGPIASGIEGFVNSQVANVVASPQFATAWDEANRLAHEQLVGVLTGEGTDAISVEGGTVAVKLGPFVETVKQTLIDRGFGLASNIPAIDTEIVILQSEELANAQTAFTGLDWTAILLPLLVVGLLIAGVALAPSRRLGFLGAGVAVTVAMLVALGALAVGRIIYLRELPTDILPRGAAGSVFDILTRFLRQGLLVMLFFGLVTMVAALLAGPSRGAVAFRRGWVHVLQRANHGLRSLGVPTQPAAPWVERYAQPLRVAAVAVGGLVLLLWNYPTPVVALWLAVVVVVALAVVDLLRAPVTDEEQLPARTTAAPAE